MFWKVIKDDGKAIFIPIAISVGVTVLFSLFFDYYNKYHYAELAIILLSSVSTVIMLTGPNIVFGILAVRCYRTMASVCSERINAMDGRTGVILTGKFLLSFVLMVAAWAFHILLWWNILPGTMKRVGYSSEPMLLWSTFEQYMMVLREYDFAERFGIALIAVAVFTIFASVLQMLMSVLISGKVKNYRPWVAVGTYAGISLGRFIVESVLQHLVWQRAMLEKINGTRFPHLSIQKILTAYFNQGLVVAAIYLGVFCLLCFVVIGVLLRKKENKKGN